MQFEILGPRQVLDAGHPLALGQPKHRAVQGRLRDAGRRRPVLELRLSGAFFAALRAGANLAPGNRSGGATWPEFLDLRSPLQLPKG